MLAVSKQLSDIACQSNSGTLIAENAFADVLSQLNAVNQTLPIANPVLKKEHQKRSQPAPGNPTSAASKKIGRQHSTKNKQQKKARNAAATGGYV